MKKKMFLIIGVAVIGVAVGLNINRVLGSNTQGDIFLVNIEALAKIEDDDMTIGCANDYMPVLCQYTCSCCGIVWKAVGGYGTPCCPKGTCICGTSFN